MPLLDRAGLSAVLDRYLEHRHAGRDVGGLLGPRARTVEYGVIEAGSDKSWTAAAPTGYRLVFADEARGEVGCHATFIQDDLVGIYALRLKVESDGRVGEVESLFARKGDSNAFAAHRLKEPDPLFARIEPEAARSSRATLIAAADAYFDAVERSDASAAPIAKKCERFENGLRTTNNPAGGLPLDCREGMKIFTYIDRVRDRRYPLVDEARGVVWSSAALEVPPGQVLRLTIDGKQIERPQAARSIFLSELFKIVDGEIVAIDVVVRNMPKGSIFGFEA
jgi:hypothetical protein